jgi:hypothetical protein
VPWQSAASKSSAADDPHFKFFTLVKDSAACTGQQAQHPKDAAAQKAGGQLSMSGDIGGVSGRESSQHVTELSDCLQLSAKLPWPLGVLITPRHLDDYNNLFALLLKVKRVQLDLEAAWQELGRCAHRAARRWEQLVAGGCPNSLCASCMRQAVHALFGHPTVLPQGGRQMSSTCVPACARVPG